MNIESSKSPTVGMNKPKSKYFKLILLIIIYCLLIIVLSIGFLLSRKPSDVTKNSTDDTQNLDDLPDKWLEYTNAKYGFTIMYPDIGLTPQEKDIFTERKDGYAFCDADIGVCPSFIEGKYQIVFIDNNMREVSYIDIYDVELSLEFWDGVVHDGFTYLVNSVSEYVEGEGWVNQVISEEVRDKMQDSIKFIDKEKPKECLWLGEYISYSKQEVDMMKTDMSGYLKMKSGVDYLFVEKNKTEDYYRHYGWRYDWNSSICEEAEYYNWNEESSAPPFKSQSECMQICENTN